MKFPICSYNDNEISFSKKKKKKREKKKFSVPSVQMNTLASTPPCHEDDATRKTKTEKGSTEKGGEKNGGRCVSRDYRPKSSCLLSLFGPKG